MANVLLLGKMSWRNLWRHPRRTLLTALILGLGLALLLICLGLADGAHNQAIAFGVKLRTGHVVVQARGYQETRAQGLLLPAEVVSTVESSLLTETMNHLLAGMSARLVASGLLSSATNSSGVSVLGVIPAAEKTVSLIPQRIIAGLYLPDETSSSEVVMGVELARKLRVKVGSKVVLMVQSIQQLGSERTDGTGGEIHSALLRVRGIFRTGVREIDRYIVHASLRRTQEFLGVPDQVSQVAIVLEQEGDVPLIATYLRQLLPGSSIEVLTWREAIAELAQTLWLDDAANYVVNGILLIIVGLGGLNTILMNVLERRYEFGVCAALGVRPGQFVGMILYESFALVLISLALGLVLGLGVHYYFATSGLDLRWFTDASALPIPIVYSRLSLRRIFWSLVVVFVMAMVLFLYPAFKAARIKLPDALKML